MVYVTCVVFICLSGSLYPVMVLCTVVSLDTGCNNRPGCCCTCAFFPCVFISRCFICPLCVLTRMYSSQCGYLLGATDVADYWMFSGRYPWYSCFYRCIRRFRFYWIPGFRGFRFSGIRIRVQSHGSGCPRVRGHVSCVRVSRLGLQVTGACV